MVNNKFIVRVKDFFNAFAQDYNLLYPQWNSVDEHIAQGIHAFIKKHEKKTKKILDLGSGTGLGTLGLAKLGYELTSVDISPKMLKVLSENAKKRKLSINIIEGDIHHLDDIIKEKYDLVICRGNTITYLPEHTIKKTLSMIYKCLNPGGIIYLGLREWENFLVSSDNPITHLSRIPYDDGVIYDCYYDWKMINSSLVHLDVLFYFYNDDIVLSLLSRKIYSVEFYTYKIKWLINKLKEVNFSEVRIVEIPEEKMDGEEYTVVCGKKQY